MYPSYRPREVMEEYAITFFALLAEGYRQKYKHYHMLARIYSLPHVRDDNARKEFMQQLEWATKDPNDILNPGGEASPMDDVKRFFGSK